VWSQRAELQGIDEESEPVAMHFLAIVVDMLLVGERLSVRMNMTWQPCLGDSGRILRRRQILMEFCRSQINLSSANFGVRLIVNLFCSVEFSYVEPSRANPKRLDVRCC
jgi:hypothetical protein